MSNGTFFIPYPENEPVFSYEPGSPERAEFEKVLAEMKNEVRDIPMVIGSEEVRTDNKKAISPPYDHQHIIGHYHFGDESHVKQAINAALGAKEQWETLSMEHRASIFLKAAELISGPYRQKINAATMLAQSKNIFQAEIDGACEMIDFLRYNAYYMQDIYNQQPENSKGIWNRLEYRPLEGFVFAITPFNFTAISGNLPASAALMGNTVVWKPAEGQVYSAYVMMEVFREAGMPDGVINLIYTDGPTTGDIIFSHPDFAGIHFTGSTAVFKTIWKTIGENIDKYRSYPRIVGETGGKDFIVMHESANADEVVTRIVRGAFEFQGQKCSAASRTYIPSNRWEEVKEKLVNMTRSIKMGSPEDFTNFVNAVIDERAFDKITSYIDWAKNDEHSEIIVGGNYDKSKGYFIEPTIIVSKDPKSKTMEEEIFGPVLTIYVYNEFNFEDVLSLVDMTSPYALTGAVFAKDRYIIELATNRLRHAAGNFYINDKPTGAVVGHQPFGGARGSGTNDKAGFVYNLIRWTSVRTIKETFVPPTDYQYPFMK